MRTFIVFVIFVVCMSFTANATIVQFGNQSLNIASYLQFRYNATAGSLDNFTVPRLRTDIWGAVDSKFSYFLEIDYTQSPALIYGWADMKLTKDAKFRMGKFYYPFGLEYTTPPKNFDTINPCNAAWAFFGYSRDIGVELKAKTGILDNDWAVVNGNDNSATDNNQNKAVVGRELINITDGFRVGGSVYRGRSGVGTLEADKIVNGAELLWEYNNFTLKGEYISGKDANVEKNGYYIQPLLEIRPDLQLLVRYEDWDPNTSLANNRIMTTTLGFNLWLTEAAKVQVNYEIKEEEANKVNNNAFLAQFQLDF